jgi:hypothetical protein
MGQVKIRFVPDNTYGVLDHDVTLGSGLTVNNPMRVVQNQSGSEFIFTLFRQPEMSDENFAEDRAAVEKDLQTLKGILERQSPERHQPPAPDRVAESIENAASKKLTERPIHLGLGATAIVQPPITGMEWYADYGTRSLSDGADGRLVSMHTFEASWDSWEMHPNGAEVVLCTAGEITLVQEIDGHEKRIRIAAGEYAINAPGVWHSAEVLEPATLVFITAGLGTEHRPRKR